MMFARPECDFCPGLRNAESHIQIFPPLGENLSNALLMEVQVFQRCV